MAESKLRELSTDFAVKVIKMCDSMTDYHLDVFFGAYKRLTMLANDKASLNII